MDIDWEDILPFEGDEALTQIAQRSCDCPISGTDGALSNLLQVSEVLKCPLPMAGGLKKVEL